MEHYYRNKRVALIGPAPHITELEQKEYIDGFDTVVRLNYGYPVDDNVKEKTGERCDVLYASPLRMKKGGIDIPVIPHPDYPGSTYPYEMFKKILSQIDRRPNVGLMAIEHILSYKPKELYVTGITFFQTGGYYDGYDAEYVLSDPNDYKKTFVTHNPVSQLKYFIENLYDKIIPDNELKKVVDESCVYTNQNQ